MPVESATIEIAIVIENSRSLKLRQTQVVSHASNSINTKREAFGPLLDPLMGPMDV